MGPFCTFLFPVFSARAPGQGPGIRRDGFRACRGMPSDRAYRADGSCQGARSWQAIEGAANPVDKVRGLVAMRPCNGGKPILLDQRVGARRKAVLRCPTQRFQNGANVGNCTSTITSDGKFLYIAGLIGTEGLVAKYALPPPGAPPSSAVHKAAGSRTQAEEPVRDGALSQNPESSGSGGKQTLVSRPLQ